MRRAIRALATAGGVGYLPVAAGTAGSFVGLLLGLATRSLEFRPQLALLFAGFLLSVAVSTAAEQDFGIHDAPMIVIDEVCAMWAVCVVVPAACHQLLPALGAFLLFRVFDISKPFPLKPLSRLPAGWGIVCDDLGAAVYASLILYGASAVGLFAWR